LTSQAAPDACTLFIGEGCINIREISDWVDATGFTGHREVEIFSNKWWATDQLTFLDNIASSYTNLYQQ
jgi:sugar phosphate isomerase/epimerase